MQKRLHMALITTLIFSVSGWAQDNNTSNMELEKMRLENERMKLELEREKLHKETSPTQANAPLPENAKPEAPKPPTSFYFGFQSFNGSGSLTRESDYYNTSIDYDIDNAGQGLLLGFGAPKGFRFEIASTSRTISFDQGGKQDVSQIDLNLLYAFGTYKPDHLNFFPFLKLGYGFPTYDYSNSAYAGDDKVSGFAARYGLGCGFLLADHFELTLSYEFEFALHSYEVSRYNSYYSETDTVTNSESTQNLMIGFNLHL